jgi:hypothetical protein
MTTYTFYGTFTGGIVKIADAGILLRRVRLLPMTRRAILATRSTATT